MSFKEFTIERSKIFPEVILVTPSAFSDFRGAIYTAYHQELFAEFLDKDLHFKHDKFIRSKKDVIRGFHGDNKTWKLVTCVYGNIFQVIVDNRPESPTYQKWESFSLEASERKLLLVPPRFGNALCTVSEESLYYYKLAYEGEYVDALEQFVIKWNDPALNVNWPTDNPILQKRDQ